MRMKVDGGAGDVKTSLLTAQELRDYKRIAAWLGTKDTNELVTIAAETAFVCRLLVDAGPIDSCAPSDDPCSLEAFDTEELKRIAQHAESALSGFPAAYKATKKESECDTEAST